MDNRKKEYLESRRNKRSQPEKRQFKTEQEKQETRDEVEQIRKDLINFAKTTWGREWIISNLKIGRPFRMQRGIEYVKDGRRIDNFSISTGQIFATVQGTAPTPYRVKIQFPTIPKEEWKALIGKLTEKTINLIDLLDGILPENIIEIFEESKYSLFPDSAQGLNANCSCPDKAVPCKHIAAVILYLARVLDYNPLILLELLGKTKSEIFNDLSLEKSNLEESSRKIAKKLPSEENIEFEFNNPKLSIQELTSREKLAEKDYKVGFKLTKPGKIIETMENLGIPKNIENKAFEIVFKAIYRSITTNTYKMSVGMEKN